MRTLLLVALIVVSACFDEEYAFEQFQRFIKKYNKQYDSVEEFMARFQVFANSIRGPNLLGLSYKTGITKFSDMTRQEFRRTYLNLNFNALAGLNLQPANFVRTNDAAPDELNFIEQGYLQGVKDQGSCGSCFAFATIANIEGLYFTKYGKNKEFSEQMIVDCDTLDSGCNGGLMELTFEWIKSNGGIMSMADYPYKGRKQSCKADKTKYDPDVVVTGWEKLGDPDETWSPVDEDEIKEYLYAKGPLAIALNADPLQYYSSGIINLTARQCDPDGMNHAVTLVGYGTDNNTPYWLVRNSWGKSWGEKGYFRVYRGSGVCGINQYITTAILE